MGLGWDGVCGMEENKKSASPKKNCACGGGVGVGIEGRAIVAIDAIVAIEGIEAIVAIVVIEGIEGVEGRGCCGLGGCGFGCGGMDLLKLNNMLIFVE